MKAVGAYFRALREHLDLSQEDLARRVDITVKQVYNWERGSNLPKSPQLAVLLEVLGGDYEDISSFLRLANTSDFIDNTSPEDGARLAQQRINLAHAMS